MVQTGRKFLLRVRDLGLGTQRRLIPPADGQFCSGGPLMESLSTTSGNGTDQIGRSSRRQGRAPRRDTHLRWRSIRRAAESSCLADTQVARRWEIPGNGMERRGLRRSQELPRHREITTRWHMIRAVEKLFSSQVKEFPPPWVIRGLGMECRGRNGALLSRFRMPIRRWYTTRPAGDLYYSGD